MDNLNFEGSEDPAVETYADRAALPEAGIRMVNDATILTPYNEADYEGKTMWVTLGPNQFAKNWTPRKLPISGIIDQFSRHSVGKKDGLAVVFADMVAGQRVKKAVKSCTAIGLDIDNGVPSAEIDKALAKIGCLAVRTTTHSHGKRSSEFSKDKILKFRPDIDTVDSEIMRDFVREVEYWDHSIVKTVEFVEEDHSNDKGIVYRISHAPMPKHRVIVPLAEPYVISEEGRTQIEAMAKWAKVPEAFATLLSVPFDRSCTDPSRLFYLPRHDKNRPFEISLFGGPLFNRRSLNLENAFDVVAAEFAKGSAKSKTPEGKKLGRWFKKCAHGFQIMDVIEEYAPNRKRSKATLGYNIECPFDEDHSNAGNPNDAACYAVNAAEGGNEFCIVKCQHEGCKEKTLLDMIGKMVKDGWFEKGVLEDENYNIAQSEDASDADIRRPDDAAKDGYGGALVFATNRGQLPKGVTFDKESGGIHPTFLNTLLLVGSERWDLGYNELTQNYGLRGDGPYPWPEHLGYAFNDAIRREIRLYLLRQWGVTFKIQDVEEASMTLARRNAFNPVCDYLGEVECNWDGVARLDRFFETYMGVKATEANRDYVRAIGCIMFVAGARRARLPGCKYDEMVILEGPQGGGKSTALRILGGEHFSDANLGDLTKKEAPMKLRGVWVQEFGELAALRKAEVDVLKEFLSQQSDRYKIPYAKFEEDFPRRCLFIGTVNPGGGAYLVDLTGNRRLWPIACGEIDLAALERDRDQLWAEAATMESRGDSIRLDPSLYDAAKAEQEARLADDPFVEILAEYLEDKAVLGSRVLSKDLLGNPAALALPPERQGQLMMKKLRTAMAAIPGWEYKPSMRADGVKSAGYEFVGRPSGVGV